MPKNKFRCLLHTFPKINSKWIKELNVNVKTLTLLEENIGANFLNLGLADSFLEITPKAQVT